MTLLRKLFVIAGALFIAGGAALLAAYGPSFGNLLSLAAGGALIGLGLWFGRLPRPVQTAICVLSAAGCLFFLVTLSIIILGGARSADTFDDAQIIVEDRARDTRQNFQFSKQLLDSLFGGREYSVACITSDYHVYRSRLISRRNAIDADFYPAGTPWYLRPAAWCRELLSVCLAWVRE